jgi:hypothetical protein
VPHKASRSEASASFAPGRAVTAASCWSQVACSIGSSRARKSRTAHDELLWPPVHLGRFGPTAKGSRVVDPTAGVV